MPRSAPRSAARSRSHSRCSQRASCWRRSPSASSSAAGRAAESSTARRPPFRRRAVSLAPAEGYDGAMSLVSDSERERAAATLRQQFVHGRLSTEQLAERVELALAARNRRDVKRAFRGLPPIWRDTDELRRIGLQAKRRAVRAAVAAAWIFVT